MSENENLEEMNQTEAAENAAEKSGKGSEKEPEKPFAGALEWAGSLVYAVLAMLVLNLFVFRSITVDGDSMNNTLQDKDRVLSTNFFYTPQRGDIVVLQADKIPNQYTGKYGEPIIKRVIALAGDTIKFDFDEGEVYLRKAGEQEFQLLEEDYIAAPTLAPLDRHSGEEHTVPDNCVFVMGDNRNKSLDSRSVMYVGDVDTDLIMGKAFVRLFPLDQFTWL
ncbi:MAG: signal peptidase I [Oscillospiraceae bacterium]